jgi:signal transduction histidine kinase
MRSKSTRVLLIEDSPADARLITEALRESGPTRRFDVQHQGDLTSGLERLLVERFDVLLLDLGLPESTGIDTFITAERSAPDVPIVVLTGIDDDVVAEEAIAMGAQDYIAKQHIEGHLLSRAIRYSIERKSSEIALRRANAELEGYAHTVSHDLRSPLAAVAIANALLADAVDLPYDELIKEIRESTSAIKRNLERCDVLVEDLLSLAKAGRKPAEISSVDLNDVVEQVLHEKTAQIRESGTRVAVDEDLGTIAGSDTQMYQLFSNLISNGMIHNNSDSPVLEVHAAGPAEDGLRVFKVCDNGEGIPPELVDDYLMPFARGTTGGFGIGLSIVKKIIEQHGGYLSVYNDGMTCFEFGLRDLE